MLGSRGYRYSRSNTCMHMYVFYMSTSNDKGQYMWLSSDD